MRLSADCATISDNPSNWVVARAGQGVRDRGVGIHEVVHRR